MRLNFTRVSRFALEGIRPVTYDLGVHDVPDEVATVAIAEGWAKPAAEKPAAEKSAAEKSAGGEDDGKKTRGSK